MVLKGVLFQVLLTPWKMRITWLAHVSGSPMYLARPCIWLAHIRLFLPAFCLFHGNRPLSDRLRGRLQGCLLLL